MEPPRFVTDEVKNNFLHRPAVEMSIEGFTRSAVLVTVLRDRTEDFILFTRRTDQVEHHKNQISFPGGRLDEGETLLECALRETYEEVGIAPLDVQVIGRLDDTWTPTKYVISPFVGIVSYPCEFKVSAAEIDDLLVLPLTRLFCPDRFTEDVMSYLGRTAKIPFFYIGETIIWGATARILRQFLQVAFNWEGQPCEK